MFMFVAAAAMFATSCGDEEDNGAPITEANIIGEWGWPRSANFRGTIEINEDHTMYFSNLKFTWTLSGHQFVAKRTTNDGETAEFNFEIKSLAGDKMKIAGRFKDVYSGHVISDDDISATLVKTVVETPTTIEDATMTGSWQHAKLIGSIYSDDWKITFNSDHTCSWQNGEYQGTWSISGNNVTVTRTNGSSSDYALSLNFKVDKITSTATYIAMQITGVSVEGNSEMSIDGRLSKDI